MRGFVTGSPPLVQDSFNATSPGGVLIFRLIGALAEFQRNPIRERTKAGLAAARARDTKGGRRRALKEEQTQRPYQLYDDIGADGGKKYTIKEICEMMGVSRTTIYSYLGARNAQV